MLSPKKIKTEQLLDQDKQRLDNFIKILGRRKHFDQIEYHLYSLASKLFPGEGIISFVPETLLYSSKTEPLRNWLQDICVIRAIINLPHHALQPHTQTKISIIILEKQYLPDYQESDIYIAKANKLSDLEDIIINFFSR
ncbi:hypothetical protein [Desulfuribacillus alkaliarsenatis]|uniref:Uncharacterized protein n=1 Tax=Desulfuribacillus alkaliarsenatis TaxID=766136 RepID=A0A1E5G0Y5_9FIRM|nr:hypothetical protein [Desulfuribacillus alkaliarsenatis]OEF96566.1 hypothetical protein BHF68_07930 [Desulfuribacillus alkaliarsenatis]